MIQQRKPAERENTQFLKRSSKRTLFLYGGMGILFIAVLIILGKDLGHHIRVIDAWITSLGPWATLGFIGVFVAATSVFIPETVLSIMAGALFGMTEGLLVVVMAGLAAATVQFFLSRRIFRKRIDNMLAARPSLAAIRCAVMQNELRLQTLIRLTPLNPATLNYLLGATGVRFPGFLLASLAFLPHQAVEVYFGYAGKDVATIAVRRGSVAYLHDAVVFGGLILSIAALALIVHTARKAMDRAITESADSGTSDESPSSGSKTTDFTCTHED
ncbi:MAG TPA: VTT domain-containing protein [Thermoanaerobaculia bacterium]|nr:VTT domain-containing protein [Thermoanaerobaculia bacterium]HUM31032.1 VTT domain-containing protein [Thermoanaerobaculia bacterium]HXK69330.1 VTT domain-containing protein [Thermoanaerobaculia bacterium]